jgi:tetratricopeptide (TPR) repeat protein
MSDLFISRENAEAGLLDLATYIGERIKSSDGHAEAMNAVIPMYLAKNEVDLAAELANAVDDPFSRDKLLTLVAERCAQIDDVDYALQLIGSIDDHGIRSQAYERVGVIRAAAGDAETALSISDQLSHPDFILAEIAVKKAEGNDPEGARTALSEIGFATAKVSAMEHIADVHLRTSESEKAVEWLDLAAETASNIEHDEERIRTVCEIGNRFIEAKRNDKAITTFDAAREYSERLDNTHRDHFLATCAVGFLYAGSSDLAENALDLVTDKTQMSSALLNFARRAWESDEKEAALETLDEAYEILRSQRESETRDSRSKNRLMTNIAVQFAGFGKTERAVEIARENPDPEEETSCLAQIAQILVAQDEGELARQTVNEIDDDADRLQALIGIADAHLKKKNAEVAIDLLNEAASLAEEIPQLGARSMALNGIAARLAMQGKIDEARNLEIENLSVILQIKDASSRSALLVGVSEVSDSSGLDLANFAGELIQKLIGP